MKSPIDAIRDAALQMQVGDDNDRSAIKEAITLPDRLLIVKEQGIWQAQLADDIDPARTNVNIPHTNQKILARGTSDPFVGRTLLQAKALLRKTMLGDQFNEGRSRDRSAIPQGHRRTQIDVGRL